MPINDLDNPHKTGLVQAGLAFLNFVLCFAAGPVVGLIVVFGSAAVLGDEQRTVSQWHNEYVHFFLRAEWFAFLFGVKLHTRMVTRAIRFGPLHSKVYWPVILWPLLLTCLVALTCGLAHRYAFADIPYDFAPQGAQLVVWFVWESAFDAFFKYVPGLPTTKEIERSFTAKEYGDGLR